MSSPHSPTLLPRWPAEAGRRRAPGALEAAGHRAARLLSLANPYCPPSAAAAAGALHAAESSQAAGARLAAPRTPQRPPCRLTAAAASKVHAAESRHCATPAPPPAGYCCGGRKLGGGRAPGGGKPPGGGPPGKPPGGMPPGNPGGGMPGRNCARAHRCHIKHFRACAHTRLCEEP